MSNIILAQIDLGSTIGIGYLSVAISAIFYGVTVVQTFHYYRSANAKRDVWWIRLLVAVIWALDSAHQAFVIHIWYYYLVLNYANPFALLESVWSIPVEIIITTITAFLVECFLVARIWRMSQNKYLVWIVAFMCVAQLGANITFPIRGFFIPNIVEAETRLKVTGTAGLGVATVTDVLLSGCLAFYLHKSRTGFRRSDDIITKLIALTITTGSLTTIFVIVDLIAYLVAPLTLYNLFFNVLLAKLYSNWLLTSLNTRDFVRSVTHDVSSSEMNSFHNSRFDKDARVVNIVRSPDAVPFSIETMVETVVTTDPERAEAVKVPFHYEPRADVEKAYGKDWGRVQRPAF